MPSWHGKGQICTKYMVWEVDVTRMEEMAWNTVWIIVDIVIVSSSSSYWLQKLQHPPVHSGVHTHDTVAVTALCTWISCEICVRWPTLWDMCQVTDAVRYVSGDRRCLLTSPINNTDTAMRILFLWTVDDPRSVACQFLQIRNLAREIRVMLIVTAAWSYFR